MVYAWVTKSGASWFGLACYRQQLVATAVGPTRERALAYLMGNIPAGTPRQLAEGMTEFARETIRMFAELESGREEKKRFTLCEKYLPEGLRNVLYAASAIPIGYVTSYGNIAKTVGTVARAVGRIMATNPLYPIVPCHRVVGSDLALVGYGGRRDDSALRAKLNRLRGEIRGYAEEASIPTIVGALRVYPVEWAVKKAARFHSNAGRQLPLFGC
jgi:O-6-methylguanine DNA methyltransferase